MFRAQNLAMPINPSAGELYCYYLYHTGCGWNYHSYCGWNYYSYCGWYYYSWCHYYTYETLPQVQQACPAATAIGPGPVGPGDPVEALQALKKQLELALASVEAQERVLHEHRTREGERGAAAQGKTPERKA